MAMQIQRGLVKYKDRSDIICTYGVSSSGIQYYFLDEAKLANGNIIVTTTLLEAVDPVAVASHVGVIDPDGNVVIQCVNKSIKPISSDILLVEKAQPTSQNVLDTIKLRDDPNAATKLVTTPATIKDNINKVMDSNGRFVFNDQFSEASIYDIDGNNLVNDELYSFIGVDDKRIYFSKNTVDSEVIQLSLNNASEDDENKVPTLNVETTDITKDVIEKALNDDKEEDNAEETPAVEDKATEEVTEEHEKEEEKEESSAVETFVYSEDATTPEYSEEDNTKEEKTEETVEEKEQAEENIIPDVDDYTYTEEVETPTEESTNEYSEEVNIPVEENHNEDVSTEEKEENIIPEVEEEEIPLNINTDYTEEDNTNEVYEEPSNEEDDEEEEEIVPDRLEEMPEDRDEDEDDSEEDGGREIEYNENYEEDNFDNPMYVEDEYDYGYQGEDSYNNLVESYNYSNNSNIPQKNIFDDVTVTISNLVELNRNLQSMVDSYEIKLAKCDASRKKLVELSKSQAREISSLNARVARLEADKQLLEAKVNALTPSSNGDLVRAMADANNILAQTRTLRRNKNY